MIKYGINYFVNIHMQKMFYTLFGINNSLIFHLHDYCVNYFHRI